ncbi:antibiotic biosynthesis monooxygenase [Streptomyces xylophagus]|uniref:antibiotic biosynthesis monooxygenase n=1 Tax=Streptomyces xylophagus TaxID=285514 RepID=UPI0007C4D7E2|nr:antibiotic biosynthesis monooxygenase [Streptomyces xylophagus]
MTVSSVSSSVSNAGFIALVTVKTKDAATQQALVEMLSRDVEAWVRHCPGFLSANYHLSTDGTSLVNYAQWTTEEAYRKSFERNPDKEAMRRAIRELPGVLDGPSMTGYRLERSITAPQDVGPGEDVRPIADWVRRGAMQLGSRLRKELPENPPAVPELTLLVQLTNNRAPRTVRELAAHDEVPAEAARDTLAGLASRGLVEAVDGDAYAITPSGQEVLDAGRRARTDYLTKAIEALGLTASERAVLLQAGPLLERLARY